MRGYGVGPHDYDCICWRCQSRRLDALRAEKQRNVQLDEINKELNELPWEPPINPK